MENVPWRQKLDQFKIPIALSILGLVLIVGGIFASSLNTQRPKSFPKDSLIQDQKIISVDVSGAVQKPGVYKLQEGSRIEEAINLAGGFTEAANGEYISKYLNMAQKLSDGSKVYVPFAKDTAGVSVTGTSVNKQININTASQSELEALPGIGPVTAGKIMAGRPYQAVEDLIKQKIVGQAIFVKIKDFLVVY